MTARIGNSEILSLTFFDDSPPIVVEPFLLYKLVPHSELSAICDLLDVLDIFVVLDSSCIFASSDFFVIGP